MGEPNSLGAASGEKCQTTTSFDCHSCQPDPGFDGQSFEENFFVFKMLFFKRLRIVDVHDTFLSALR